MKPLFKTALASLILAAHAGSLPEAFGQELHVVAKNGGGEFSEIRDAIDASVDGDILLVKDGVYAGFVVNGKGLTIVADRGHQVRIDAIPGSTHTLTVQNTGPDQPVVLSGLSQYEAGGSGLNGGVVLSHCQGEVLVAKCSMTESVPKYGGADGQAGLLATACDYVTITHCLLRGCDADQWCEYGPDGGDGVRMRGSESASYHSVFSGGKGGRGLYCSGLYCTAVGGDGGDGLELLEGSIAFTQGVLGEAGDGGLSDCGGPYNDGDPGERFLVDATSILTSATFGATELTMDRARREGQAIEVQCHGEPDAPVFLLRSTHLMHRDLGDAVGVLHLAPPFEITFLGSLQGGSLHDTIQAPPVPPGQDAQVHYYQFFTPAAAGRVLSNPCATVVFR